jgi:hypothetical protein
MNYFKLIYHRARKRWNQVICLSIAEQGGLTHQQRMCMDSKYFNAYSKYQESKEILAQMGPSIGNA